MSECKDLMPVNMENLATLSKSQIREMLAIIEAEMLKGEQVALPLRHTFSPGVYARELDIPKGTLVMGKIHKFENMSFLIKGELSVFTVDGGVQRLKAPYINVAQPGVKRFVYAHEDATWVSVLGTDEKDPEKIEQQFTTLSYSEVPGLLEDEGELCHSQSHP